MPSGAIVGAVPSVAVVRISADDCNGRGILRAGMPSDGKWTRHTAGVRSELRAFPGR